jgi:hypothetical protein
MRKILLNLIPGEPLTPMKKLPYFEDLIEFDSLLGVFIERCILQEIMMALVLKNL